MRIVLVGSGGVGDAFCRLIASRGFLAGLAIADVNLERAEAVAVVARSLGCPEVTAICLDASDQAEIESLLRVHRADVLVNACDPRFNPPLFRAAEAAGCNYLDMAMTLSQPHLSDPFRQTGVLLGAEQFAAHERWVAAGKLALVGMGVEPGLSDVFARFASDHLFSCIDEIGVRDGSNLVIDGYDFAPTFSIWTTIEECLNPPLIYERDRGWFTTEPFSEPEVFDFPGGIGPVECVNVEHEEVLLIPKWIPDVSRVTFKYGLGQDFIDVLKTIHRLGMDSTKKVKVGPVEVSPRDVLAATLPNPATLGDRMRGVTCAGTWVRGTRKDGTRGEVYLHHLVDNDWSMREFGCQAVVWQTAVNPVIALELIASGVWSGVGVLGPEAFDAVPFLQLLADYGAPFGLREEGTRIITTGTDVLAAVSESR
jgi:saccharopine dehydrogenase (NAD+, L-lysine forming)